MIELNNKIPEKATENTKKTLARLEKIHTRIKNISDTIVKGGVAIPLAAGASFTVTAMTGMFSGLTFVGLGAAVASVPIATALLIAPTIAENILKLKINSLSKKLENPILQIIETQKGRARRANLQLLKALSPEEVEVQEKELVFQRDKESIYIHAAERAKKEGKEKTIGRLMRIVEKAESGSFLNSSSIEYGAETLLQGVYAGIATPHAIRMFGTLKEYAKAMASFNPMRHTIGQLNHLNSVTPTFSKTAAMVVGGVAVVSLAATAYCAAKTVESIKKERNADKAFNILREYSKGNTNN